MNEVAEHVEFQEDELGHHPSPRQYVFIAAVLAIVTAMEVAIYYFDMAPGLLVGLLVTFAVIKFVMVASFFMHLRFDHRVFRRLFMVGIFAALSLFAIVLTIFFAAGGGPAPLVNG